MVRGEGGGGVFFVAKTPRIDLTRLLWLDHHLGVVAVGPAGPRHGGRRGQRLAAQKEEGKGQFVRFDASLDLDLQLKAE
jgi:hypothetical protein